MLFSCRLLNGKQMQQRRYPRIRVPQGLPRSSGHARHPGRGLGNTAINAFATTPIAIATSCAISQGGRLSAASQAITSGGLFGSIDLDLLPGVRPVQTQMMIVTLRMR